MSTIDWVESPPDSGPLEGGFVGIAAEARGEAPTLDQALDNAAKEAGRAGALANGPVRYEVTHMEVVINQHVRTYRVIITPTDT